jgi:hypothetical protein
MAYIYERTKNDINEIAAGVMLDRIQPGGKRGPDDVVLSPKPGGFVYNDYFLLGSKEDEFQMNVPDIRMPPNQIWPLHWHGCWIAVLVLDGTLLVGDWWMNPGDMLISAAELEYGPVVSGPEGCQIFEIFAKNHIAQGGYAPEYRDHPTLQGWEHNFAERSALNQRNRGHQVLPNSGVEGLTMTHLEESKIWDLGDPSDANRGLMKDTRLAAGERRSAHRYADWHGIFVLDGSMRVGDRQLQRNDVLIIKPGAYVETWEGGSGGAHLFEVSRIAKGMAPAFV